MSKVLYVIIPKNFRENANMSEMVMDRGLDDMDDLRGSDFIDPSEPIYTDPALFERSRSRRMERKNNNGP